MTVPNCLACVHCDLREGWPGTEITPGEPMDFYCLKGKWDLARVDRKRDIFDAAKGCSEFKPEEWAK